MITIESDAPLPFRYTVKENRLIIGYAKTRAEAKELVEDYERSKHNDTKQ